MRNLLNYALFQGVWFAAVQGAAEGRPWQGALAAVAMLLVHLPLAGHARQELVFVLSVALAGSLADSGLWALGVIDYPAHTTAWSAQLVPPWICALWLAVGMLPRFSLGWLRSRPLLAAVLGAAGGPLSFLAGEKMGVVSSTSSLTWIGLAIEYALVMPLLLRLAPDPQSRS